jgi:FkbM family methyltransferase
MGIKAAIYKALVSPPSVRLTDLVARRFYGGMIPNRGRRIDTNDPSVTPWVRSLVFWDLYESAELRLIQRHMPKDLDVIELGGSIGVVASQIAGCLGAGRRLVSVEANPQIVDLLRRNIEANGPQVRATVVHGAVAYGTPPAEYVEMSFGNSTLAAWVSQSGEQGAVCRVPRVTLGDLASRNEIGRFALVADIEGAEAGIFAREREALSRCPLMIIELHETTFEGRDLTIPDLVAMAGELGFTVKDSHRDVYVLENKAALAPRSDGAA